MYFDPIIAATRFGTGLSPVIEPPWNMQEMLTRLAGPDQAAKRFPVLGFKDTVPSLMHLRVATVEIRKAKGTEAEQAAVETSRQLRREANEVRQHNALSALARGVWAQDGLRERLTAFWADHFTVIPRDQALRHLVGAYVADAIRPHVTGRFGDMVAAVVQHPLMLMYLEQSRSVGPNSPTGQKRGRGLNENLARELLELHLFGAGSGYTQADVTQVAELLTGLSFSADQGVTYKPHWAEPGAEVVLGRRYSAESDLSTVTSALHDLAKQPQTAHHIAHKLVVHFVSDPPDEDLVATVAKTFLDSAGNLFAAVAAMLNHPAAWSPVARKVRRPDLFVTSSLRALAMPAEAIISMSPKQFRRHIEDPLKLMGQPPDMPIGPDGWSEDPAVWVTPHGLAGKINWALGSPAALIGSLPDPRTFLHSALGPVVPQELTFAVGAAESDVDGIGLVLTSPAFQRI